jgi:hypothetical protein
MWVGFKCNGLIIFLREEVLQTYTVRPAGLWPSVPKLETGLLNLQNVSTGRVKFTRESNQSQDQQSVPHNLGE